MRLAHLTSLNIPLSDPEGLLKTAQITLGLEDRRLVAEVTDQSDVKHRLWFGLKDSVSGIEITKGSEGRGICVKVTVSKFSELSHYGFQIEDGRASLPYKLGAGILLGDALPQSTKDFVRTVARNLNLTEPLFNGELTKDSLQSIPAGAGLSTSTINVNALLRSLEEGLPLDALEFGPYGVKCDGPSMMIYSRKSSYSPGDGGRYSLMGWLHTNPLKLEGKAPIEIEPINCSLPDLLSRLGDAHREVSEAALRDAKFNTEDSTIRRIGVIKESGQVTGYLIFAGAIVQSNGSVTTGCLAPGVCLISESKNTFYDFTDAAKFGNQRLWPSYFSKPSSVPGWQNPYEDTI